MAVTPTYPGVYIEEIPSGVRTITGVSTAIGAFVDYFSRGPLNQAVRVFSFADFERQFGGLDLKSEASYAIQQFFLNGGTTAWVVRTTSTTDAATAAKATLRDKLGSNVLIASAASPGDWGNNLRLDVDYGTTDPTKFFNLTVTEIRRVAGKAQIVNLEAFRNLIIDATQPNDAAAVVNDGSLLIKLQAVAPASQRPAQTGTLSKGFENGRLPVLAANHSMTVRLNGGDTQTVTLNATPPSNITELAAALQSKIQAHGNELKSVSVGLVGSAATTVFLQFKAGTENFADILTFVGDLADDLGLTPNVQQYALGKSSGATIALPDEGGNKTLVGSAVSPGESGNSVRLDVDYGTIDPAKLFNLIVTSGQASEQFQDLVIDASQPNDALAKVNAGSKLIRLALAPGASTSGSRPLQTGTVSKAFDLGVFPAGTPKANDSMVVKLNKGAAQTIQLGPAPPSSPVALAAVLQTLIRASGDPLSNATVAPVGAVTTKIFLQFKAGTLNASDTLTFENGGGMLADALGLTGPGNVQQYAFSGGFNTGAQAFPEPGSNGTWDPFNDAEGMVEGLTGDPLQKSGMQALQDVDLFNILCIPATSLFSANESFASAVATRAIALCESRRAFYILDPPQGSTGANDKPPAQMAWLDANASLRSRNAALYFPRVDIPDPLNSFRLRPSPISGTIAGLYARTDASRGVFKAPAGTDASLAGVQRLEYNVTDGENGVLNPLAINALRTFPVFGPVCWGARTLLGADQIADDYKYIPVRRFALFLEESLFRGTQWVVFEPNDDALWAQIRLNLGAFMQDLFRQGAFQGTTPRQAFFVKCDSETTTQTDINNGIVNIVVGFAPLKPAEFVIVQIQQIAGQL